MILIGSILLLFIVLVALLPNVHQETNSKLLLGIGDCMKKIFPDSENSFSTAPILWANGFTLSDDSDKVTDLKAQLHKLGATKKIAISYTEIDGKILKFRAYDRSYSRSDELYAEINRISKELIKSEQNNDPNGAAKSMESNEAALWGHSERLAIAANFIGNRTPKQIQITNNLRICHDCHRVIKRIANVFQCEIIIRDTNRFHHFHTNGQCSCRDHF